jgi:hypothetical protein
VAKNGEVVADFLAERRRGRTVGKEAEGTGTQALFDKVNELVRQGNVRRVVVTDRTDRKVLDLPVNAGVIAAVLAPMMLAAGAALALAGGWHITVERTDADVVPGDTE